MAITAFIGLNGSGKSDSAVKHVIVPALKAGRHVVTNIPLVNDAIRPLAAAVDSLVIPFESDKVDPTWFASVGKQYPGAVFVVDECGRYWPAGKTQDEFPGEQMEFFSMHRHRVSADGHATQIYLVCPDLDTVAKCIRTLVESTYITVNMAALGMRGRYRVEIYRGAQALAKPQKTALINQESPQRYDPAVWAMYRSATFSETGEVGDERRVDNRAVLWKRPMFRLVLPVMAVVGVIACYKVYKFFTGSSPEPKKVSAAPIVVPAQVQLPLAQGRSVPASSSWRLLGTVSDRTGRTMAAVTRDGRIRYLDIGDCSLLAIDPSCKVDGEVATFWSGALPVNNQSRAAPVVEPAATIPAPRLPSSANPSLVTVGGEGSYGGITQADSYGGVTQGGGVAVIKVQRDPELRH